MAKREKDEGREHRIEMEAIVDAYGPEEQAMGWYYYLQDRIAFPFKAHCIRECLISPLREGEEVIAESMAPEDDCMHEMFVMVKWQGRSMGLPLSQLEPVSADEDTIEAVGDWHYWVVQGYELG
jgi:hypothetical protein